MGPTGQPTETPSDETVLLIGGGLGNAVLFSIGQALRKNGSRVIYFAGYKRAIDRYKVVEIERAAAAREGRKPQFAELIRQWGGASIVYRRRLIDAPSYTLNHEEVAKALEEGIGFAEHLTPEEVLLDDFGCARALRLSSKDRPDIVLPARTILVAAGTQPNTVLGREAPQHVAIDGKYFQAFDESGNKVTPERITKPSAAHVLMSLREDGRAISFFGDLHPSFAGNVVKAMASAKQGYPVVSRMLSRQAPSNISPQALIARLNEEIGRAHV